MIGLYSFLAGPGLWLAAIVLLGGLALRGMFLVGLSRERDRVFYNHMDLGWALRSIGHWLLPWGSFSMRSQPVFTLASFLFHICLLGAPLLLSAHNILWREAFGMALWSLPDAVADAMTLTFLVCAVFLFLRRLIRPEVRIMTSWWDHVLLGLTVLPFVTGFLATHQWGSYRVMLVLHLLCAEILLVIIPFSKLGHMMLFFVSRAFIGVEMGARRGARSW